MYIGSRTCDVPSNSSLMLSETGERTGRRLQLSERNQQAKNIKVNACKQKRK